MIIRMNPYKTLKASTLNNREVRSTPGEEMCTESTLKESPQLRSAGALFQSAVCDGICLQVLRTLRLLSDDAFSVICG